MRGAFCLSILSIFLALCSAVCSGQCTDGFTEQTFQCQYSDTCQNSVTVQIPNESQDGVVPECFATAPCCGQLFTSCTAGGNCEDIKLRGPAAKQRLQALAAESDLLVADCKGRYALYKPAPDRTNEKSRASLALLNDHLMR